MKNNYLIHYGVKGMKWGIRKDREYGRKLRYTSPTIEDAKYLAKRAVVHTLAATIPGFAEIYNAYAIANIANNTRNNLDRTDYTKKEGAPEKLSALKKKSESTSIEDDLKKCNPRIGQQKGAVSNCLYCTAAMEMRQRGYDVRARKKSQGDRDTLYEDWFEGARVIRATLDMERLPKESRRDYVQRCFDKLSQTLESQGNGARGYVGFSYEKANCGHAIYYKVNDGQVTYYDGQSGKKNPDNLLSLADPRTYSYARLDKCKVKESVTNAVISKN